MPHRRPAADTGRPAAIRHAEGGYILVSVSLVLIILLVMAAFAVDYGNFTNTGRRAQKAVDQASLAAVTELVRVERATGDRATAEAAAAAVAIDLARENGFDDAHSDIAVTSLFWKDSYGVDHAQVDVDDNDVELYFARLVIDNQSIDRSAEAVLQDCQAACGDAVLIPRPLSVSLSTGTGGDGWAPALAGELIFNLYHHQSGNTLMCVDRTTEGPCNAALYPVAPYPNMTTNYAPPLTAIGSRVYFIVQEPARVGLGCWDGSTHTRCIGYSSPLQLAAYVQNSGRANVRIDGPMLVNGLLYMYGDDNRMYCVDPNTASQCSGYPKNTPLKGVHDMALVNAAAGFAGGVNASNGQQFDMVSTPGGKIYTTLAPANGRTRIGCWDTVSASGCAGWPMVSTVSGRPWIFLRYSTSGAINGVCARAGNRGEGEVGSGHECFDLNGVSVGSPLPWAFETSGTDKAGQQSATGVTSSGQTVTFFPMRNRNSYHCWNWSTQAPCSIPPSNWSSTQEYAYVHDGHGCIFGLGHNGVLWAFGINDGQTPCNAPGLASGTLVPCACADGVRKRWTTLVLTNDTDLENFTKFVVTLRLPNGSVLDTVDLVTEPIAELDLHHLNDWPVPPPSLTVTLDVEIVSGQESVVFAAGSEQGVVLLPGIRPSLVS